MENYHGLVEVIFRNFPGTTEKNHQVMVRIADVLAKIRTQRLQNTRALPLHQLARSLFALLHVYLEYDAALSWKHCHDLGVRLYAGYELVNGFTDHLHGYKALGTTSNYSATANIYTLQITAENTTSSPACRVFDSRFIATASNSGNSSASCVQVFPVRQTFRNWTHSISNPAGVGSSLPQGGPNRKHCFKQSLYFCRRVYGSVA
jgi:hypothetical protein